MFLYHTWNKNNFVQNYQHTCLANSFLLLVSSFKTSWRLRISSSRSLLYKKIHGKIYWQMLIHWIGQIKQLLRGTTPLILKLACFVCYLKIINTFLNKAVLEPWVSPAFAIIYFCNHCNIRFNPYLSLCPTPMASKYVDTAFFFLKLNQKVSDPKMTFDPTSVEVTCVTLPKDHCNQVPWKYINVCGYSDQFCKISHTSCILHSYYILRIEWVITQSLSEQSSGEHILHTTYRMSDHILSFWRDKNNICILKQVVQGTQKWHWNFSSPNLGVQTVFKLWIKTVKYCFDQ